MKMKTTITPKKRAKKKHSIYFDKNFMCQNKNKK